jgi:hypothetical protein
MTTAYAWCLLLLGPGLIVWAAVTEERHLSGIVFAGVVLFAGGASLLLVFTGGEVQDQDVDVSVRYGKAAIEASVRQARDGAEEVGRLKKVAEERAAKIEQLNKVIEEHAEAITSSQAKAESALRKIRETEDHLTSMKEYWEIARGDFNGKIPQGGGISTDSTLAGWTAGYAEMTTDHQNKTWRIVGPEKCSGPALDQYKSVIKEHPYWPFPYFLLALCLKPQNDPSWESYAEKARGILDHTAAIPGCSPDHIEILAAVKKTLGED